MHLSYYKGMVNGDLHLLEQLNAAHAPLLGVGAEASVYALNDEQVLRIYKTHALATLPQLERLQAFYASLTADHAPFAVPHIFTVHQTHGRLYSIDRRFPSTDFDTHLGHLKGAARERALLSYIHAAEHIHTLHKPFNYFGEILAESPIRAETWPDYLRKRLHADYDRAKDIFDQHIPDMAAIMDFVDTEVELVADTARALLVHCDYYPQNALADNNGTIQAVADFNDLAVAGDPRLDLASAMFYFFQKFGNTQPQDTVFLRDYVVKKYGQNMPRIIHLYRLYHAIRFGSYCGTNDPVTFEWAMQTLREHVRGDYTY